MLEKLLWLDGKELNLESNGLKQNEGKLLSLELVIWFMIKRGYKNVHRHEK